MKKKHVFSVAVLFCVVLSGALVMAQNIEVGNNTGLKIKTLECFSDYGTEPESLALKDLAAGKSADIPMEKFPDQLCTRLVLGMEDGRKWQFYVEHEVGSLESFSFELSPIARHSEHRVPLYTAKNEDYLEQKVAGLPLFIIAQLISKSPLEDYNDWITPRTKLGSDNADFLAFAGYTWNVMPKSLVVENNKVMQMRFEVPFMITPANITTLIENLNGGDFKLRSFSVDGKEKSPAKEGLDGTNEAFAQCIDAKVCQLNFYNGSVDATLYLLDGQRMQLQLGAGIPVALFERRQAKSKN